jgi:hypothetical protein
VHMMRRISEELSKRKLDPIFFISSFLPFKQPKDWGTLIHLLNEDFDDLIKKNIPNPDSATEWLFDRFDKARTKIGEDPVFEKMSVELKKELAKLLENDSKKLLDDKIKEIQKGIKNKTVVIEFARGGAYGSEMPLPSPYGYKHSLSLLSGDILNKASVLYVWVTPEDSRRKNQKRKDPNDPGSILHHSVPLAVMYNDYGCDDFNYLIGISGRPNTIKIDANEKSYYLPIARFDNRADKTTFVRNDIKKWDKQSVAELNEALIEAFKPLIKKEVASQ